jgi:hypothetical protein
MNPAIIWEAPVPTYPRVDKFVRETLVEELPSEPGGFALGSEPKIVAVERVGTTSTGVFKALAATERLVQTDVLEAGACPKEGPEPDNMYDSSPTRTSSPVVYDLLAL